MVFSGLSSPTRPGFHGTHFGKPRRQAQTVSWGSESLGARAALAAYRPCDPEPGLRALTPSFLHLRVWPLPPRAVCLQWTR